MITIDLLKNHPELITTLAIIWDDNLGKKWFPEIPFNEIKQWYSEWLNDSIPLAYVAFDGETPVGSCSLQWNDGIRPDLTPWLGDLVVSSDYQGQGIGKRLVKFAQQQVKSMGFKRLYLYTFEQTLVSYYSQLGWEVLGHEHCQNKPVILMSIDLVALEATTLSTNNNI